MLYNISKPVTAIARLSRARLRVAKVCKIVVFLSCVIFSQRKVFFIKQYRS